MRRGKNYKRKNNRATSEVADELTAFSLEEDDDGSISASDLTHLNRLIGQTAKAFTKSGTEFLELFKKRFSLTVGYSLMDFYENMLAESDQTKRLQSMYLLFRCRELEFPLKKKTAPTLLGHPWATFFFSIMDTQLSPPYCDFRPTLHEVLLCYFMLCPNELPQWMEMSAEGFAKMDIKKYQEKMLQPVENEVTSFYKLQMARFPSTIDVEGCPSWISLPTDEDTQMNSVDMTSVISSIHSSQTASMVGLPPQWMPILPDFYPVQEMEMPEVMRALVRTREEERRIDASFLSNLPEFDADENKINFDGAEIDSSDHDDDDGNADADSEQDEDHIDADDEDADSDSDEDNETEMVSDTESEAEAAPKDKDIRNSVHTSAPSTSKITVSIPDSPSKGPLSPSVPENVMTMSMTERLVAKVMLTQVLSQSECRILLAILAAKNPALDETLDTLKELTLESLPHLIEENYKVAGEILARNLTAEPDLIHIYISHMMGMDVSVHSLETVYKIYTTVPGLDRLTLTAYVREVIEQLQQCKKLTVQTRLVRIVSLLITKLIREKYVIVRDIYQDVQAMCLQFAGHQSTTNLYQFIKLALNDEEKERDKLYLETGSRSFPEELEDERIGDFEIPPHLEHIAYS